MKALISTQNKHIRLTYMQKGLKCDAVLEKRSQNTVMSFSGTVFMGDIYKLNLDDNSVKEKHIDSKVVTTDKIATQAVTTDKLRDYSVTHEKLDSRITRILDKFSVDSVYIKASLDENNYYVVDNKIYAKDFIIYNPDGTTTDLTSSIINDDTTTTFSTWSSMLIKEKLDTKSDTDHTHSNYSLSSHLHDSRYAMKDHDHDADYISEGEAIEAEIVDNRYEVQALRAIVTSDVYATGGEVVTFPEGSSSAIIDDTTTSTSSTWSSSLISEEFNTKSDIGHTHSAYSLSTHSHSNYSPTSHTHSNYVSTSDSRLTDSRPASDVSAWAKAATKPSYSWGELSKAPTEILAPNTDLDDCTTIGWYKCASSEVASTLYHRPTAKAFSLFVESHAGVKQTLTEFTKESPKTWMRNWSPDSVGWGTWKQIYTEWSFDISNYATTSSLATTNSNVSTLQSYFTNGVAKSATKLQTPRTLWGQSFDGTGNIDGAIYCNGTITAVGDVIALGQIL